jgi:hypothetical protein
VNLTQLKKLGDLIKDRIGKILYDTLTDIEIAISEKLRPIWHGPERLRSLIDEGWLIAKKTVSSNAKEPFWRRNRISGPYRL